MVQIDKNTFLSIKTNDELAEYLGIPTSQLTFFAYSNKSFYRSFAIPKRSSNASRRIYAPVKKLKYIQRILAETLSLIYEIPDCVHGFTKTKSTATNAAQHVRKRTVIKIDIADFFPSISSGRIHGLFQSEPFNFPSEVANTLTNLTCHRGSLPQGAPTSPILSNMICFRMDRAIMKYARQNKLKYTRYADDLTFSSTTKRAIALIATFSSDGLVTINPDVVRIIESNGFAINDAKTGAYGKGTRQVVTGVVVNRKCNFKRDDYRFLRNLLHYWRSNGPEAAAIRYISARGSQGKSFKFFYKDSGFSESAFVNHIHGLLSYYLMIVRENGRHSRPLQRLWTTFHNITKVSVPDMLPEQMIFKTDSIAFFRRIGESSYQEYGETGTCFLTNKNTLVTARHCAKSQAANDLKAEYSEESMLEIISPERDINIAIPYGEMKDGRIDDWLIMQAPSDFESFPGLFSDPSYQVQEGETVIAYGFADGKNQLRRIKARVEHILQNEIVVDRAFIKGMSGGPVLNSRGDVIGLITYGSGDGIYDKDGRFMPIRIIGAFR